MRLHPCRMFSCEFVGHLRGYYCQGCPYLAALPAIPDPVPAPWDKGVRGE
ncbi:MAG: hypothetical protein HXM38_09220 [Isoptericola variabilis]|nr:hypothetical protein [Isoptericola variabilis]